LPIAGRRRHAWALATIELPAAPIVHNAALVLSAEVPRLTTLATVDGVAAAIILSIPTGKVVAGEGGA
jgi:hypothetical protein